MTNLSEISQRFTGKGLFPPQMAWTLLLPLRNLYLSPKKLIERLAVRPDSVLLEIGCGPGYFSPAVAKAASKGRLYLTDIQPEMIAKAAKRLMKKGVTNVELTVCEGSTLPYADSMFDGIYLITVLGEVAEQGAYAQEMFRILKPGGIVSITEQGGDPDALSLDEVKSILEPAGFVFEQRFGKERTYTANFKKP